MYLKPVNTSKYARLYFFAIAFVISEETIVETKAPFFGSVPNLAF